MKAIRLFIHLIYPSVWYKSFHASKIWDTICYIIWWI